MMEYSVLSEDEIKKKVLGKLVSFQLFNPNTDSVNVVKRDGDIVHIAYRTFDKTPIETTHFDLQLQGETCYLVEIELEKSKRGRGIGRNMYILCEEIAKSLGCKILRQTASGTAFDGRTRKSYLEDLGYTSINMVEVVKPL